MSEPAFPFFKVPQGTVSRPKIGYGDSGDLSPTMASLKRTFSALSIATGRDSILSTHSGNLKKVRKGTILPDSLLEKHLTSLEVYPPTPSATIAKGYMPLVDFDYSTVSSSLFHVSLPGIGFLTLTSSLASIDLKDKNIFIPSGNAPLPPLPDPTKTPKQRGTLMKWSAKMRSSSAYKPLSSLRSMLRPKSRDNKLQKAASPKEETAAKVGVNNAYENFSARAPRSASSDRKGSSRVLSDLKRLLGHKESSLAEFTSIRQKASSFFTTAPMPSETLLSTLDNRPDIRRRSALTIPLCHLLPHSDDDTPQNSRDGDLPSALVNNDTVGAVLYVIQR